MRNTKHPHIKLRAFQDTDGPEFVNILKLNSQYGYPEVEGIAAMQRVADCEAAVFIVAEVAQRPYGFIKGIYDGSRALIHLLSVHPDMQRQGIGSALVEAIRAEFKRRGAPSLSVTVTEHSAKFWKKQGFQSLPVFLMLQDSI
ncbi:MAG: GNAT family N-acetyltransferase [Anaerolineae bacterium]|nr:GNAT family N-acetyltransferase [Anaerolineae bacterium]